jgi:hypothetical protein
MDNQNNHNLEIYWTRHAESCSNLDQNHFDDKKYERYNDKTNFGYEQKTQKEYDSFFKDIVEYENEEEEQQKPKEEKGWGWGVGYLTNMKTKMTASFKYHPNLSFIGMTQAILLGENYRQINPNVVFVSPMVRTITTALLACRSLPNIKKIYVVPFIHEKLNIAGKISQDNQNTPVPSDILKRQIAFIKDWLEKKWFKYYDDIEFFNNLYILKELLEKDNNPDISQLKMNLTTLIDKFIKCKPDIRIRKNNKIEDNDYSIEYKDCIDSRTDDYRIIIEKIKEYINKKPIPTNLEELGNLQKIIIFLSNFGTETFLRGPIVDFSIYQEIENNPDEYEYDKNNPIPSIKKFRKYVLPIAYNSGLISNLKNKIAIVSHGNLLRSELNKSLYNKPEMKTMYNTQIFLEKIIYNNINNNTTQVSLNTEPYGIPPLVRSKYKNFEALNMDICRTESIKGIINYMLWDLKTAYNIQTSTMTQSWYRTPNLKEVVNVDMKDFYPEGKVTELNAEYYLSEYQGKEIKNKYLKKSDEDDKLEQIFKQKYLKYKNKYLLLKKMKKY